MKILFVRARRILNSRAEWSVEVLMELANGIRVTASVPQGKSTGRAEAVAVPASIAVKNIEKIIAPRLVGRSVPRFKSQEIFDHFLIRIDGTSDKHKLGANTILALSMAFARASAAAKHIELWRHLRGVYDMPLAGGQGVTHPRLFINMINGGMHGGSNLDIQEYVVIPKTKTFAEAADIGVHIYSELKMTIERMKGKPATNLGDEGGFAPNFKNNLEPLEILRRIVKKMKLTGRVEFGMDAAATDIKRLKPDQLFDLYKKLVKADDFIYLEDPFSEDAFEAFGLFTEQFGGKPSVKKYAAPEPLWVTGDDLTTTNVRRMETAHAEGSVNSVIIKPNQIGSVSEMLDAVRTARRYGWAVVVSHRSGETNDDFISDLAYAVGADGIKLGSPARGERVAKWNRLLAIEASV